MCSCMGSEEDIFWNYLKYCLLEPQTTNLDTNICIDYRMPCRFCAYLYLSYNSCEEYQKGLILHFYDLFNYANYHIYYRFIIVSLHINFK